ncbi:BPG_G0023120.mRNA.1.CDS.1 [Saccharomyces cerevisiae]|nr:AMP_1a_G0023440.mRNA.1.CDS.1 [Saccharomyces cerevisiae]CAI4515947.1 BBL_G0022580.mRNA.1.CDS.1 [Saccharomyces cerevisiae]CAI4884064.1 BPG_G0023120.mRNA.1.CDS.1 [Saccharomyces cerevisiae]CAI6699786.1 AMP_1a_G0023440.mRNA.1.CDS.1 [Saccharomyces cerevisiae]CAI7140810.1 BBL_G0022580.mRNA.1.CDS.1 [Saccharomyces cerevisiae]
MGSNFLYDDECTVSRDSAKNVTLTWYNNRGHKHEAAIGVRNFPIFFRIFPKKAPGRRKRKKLISPYFPVFPHVSPTSCVRIYCNARMIVRQDANGKFNCVPEPRYISEYLPDVRRRKR